MGFAETRNPVILPLQVPWVILTYIWDQDTMCRARNDAYRSLEHTLAVYVEQIPFPLVFLLV